MLEVPARTQEIQCRHLNSGDRKRDQRRSQWISRHQVAARERHAVAAFASRPENGMEAIQEEAVSAPQRDRQQGRWIDVTAGHAATVREIHAEDEHTKSRYRGERPRAQTARRWIILRDLHGFAISAGRSQNQPAKPPQAGYCE